MLGRPRLGKMGEEELERFIWLVCHFLPLMIEAGGRVIQGYHTEARRLRWAKVLYHLKRFYNTPHNNHQLKHRWADLVAREQDLLDHLGIVIGGPVAANMNPIQIREFQCRAMRYRHILDVESGFRNMARRYRHERASGVWRAFAQGGPSVSTTATTTSTSTTTQVAPTLAGTFAGPSTSTAPGPVTAPPAPPPTGMAPTRGHTSSTGIQTTPAAVIDPADFQQMQQNLDRMLRKMTRLQQEVAQVNRRVRTIKKTLRRANL
ncbi:hypothetical protein NDU88_010778 [Pleurodeles waltl]|uniref:Myb/SANT-like DNA-binding domain-containing protein n=1 Tax=Pleurodeles waltl TaxID=8319 RepID=A0AAV7RZ72_PLEWA|nr:hypothetical protein NDU88_010778 [Pleurodeles waltl]